MTELTCDCGQKYEIKGDTPQWGAPWFVCPFCFLAVGEITERTP